MIISPKYFIAALIIIIIAVMIWVDPIAQDLNYHKFADQLTFSGIPHFWNVMSNVPFLLVGVLGIWSLKSNRLNIASKFKQFYWIFFFGVLLVGLGSAWYHLNPNNSTLVWDRLPMTIAFMAFFSVIVAEYVNEQLGKGMFWPLLLMGILSIIYWQYTESIGFGDLRWYGMVQFLPLLLLPLIFLIYPKKYSHSFLLWLFLGLYLIAKLLENYDGEIFSTLNVISGHSLKHIAAATGIWFYWMYLKNRESIN